jgi:hypothetical protein
MALWGKTDSVADVPKYLSEDDKDKVYFIDTTEAGVASNKAKGLSTGGWNLYETYVDGNGNTRHKAETLVAMGVSAGDAGDAGAIVIDATAMVANTEYTIVDAGNTDFTTVGAANSDVGVTFTANGAAEGTGTVSPTEDDTVADS